MKPMWSDCLGIYDCSYRGNGPNVVLFFCSKCNWRRIFGTSKACGTIDISLHVYCLYSPNAQVEVSVKWTGWKNRSETVKKYIYIYIRACVCVKYFGQWICSSHSIHLLSNTERSNKPQHLGRRAPHTTCKYKGPLGPGRQLSHWGKT